MPGPYLGHLYIRSPDTQVRVFWGITANALTDIAFAPGLVKDQHLSQAFPDDLIASQAALLGTVPIRDLLLKNRFSARGLLRWNVYDAQRANGLSAGREPANRWIAHYASGKRWTRQQTTRASRISSETLAS